jgi:hypothetical protein
MSGSRTRLAQLVPPAARHRVNLATRVRLDSISDDLLGIVQRFRQRPTRTIDFTEDNPIQADRCPVVETRLTSTSQPFSPSSGGSAGPAQVAQLGNTLARRRGRRTLTGIWSSGHSPVRMGWGKGKTGRGDVR